MNEAKWEARAKREASEIVAQVERRFGEDTESVYFNLQGIVAIAWLHGCKTGMRETVADLETLLREMRAQ